MRVLKLAVLAFFIGFQTAQAFHTHSAVTADHCSICVTVQHTPGTDASAAHQAVTAFVFERLVASRQESFSGIDPLSTASIRAPPAA